MSRYQHRAIPAPSNPARLAACATWQRMQAAKLGELCLNAFKTGRSQTDIYRTATKAAHYARDAEAMMLGADAMADQLGYHGTQPLSEASPSTQSEAQDSSSHTDSADRP